MSDPVGTEKSETTAPKKADVIDEAADKDQDEAAAGGADEATAEEAGDTAEETEKAEEARPLTKAEKRELLRIETQRARARKAGRQAFGLAVIGLAVVAVIVGAVWFADSRRTDPSAEPAATPTAPAEEQQSVPPAVPFPPVPAGADPALSTKPTVEKGEGALEKGKPKITYVIKGTGPATKAGDLITANYVGVLYGTGEEFDSSWSRQQAIEFTIGMGQLIDGWEKGLLNVPVGSRIILDLPPDLAYGDKDDGSGRPTGDLRFVVDVLNAQGQ
ncbi:FKBP-type peptidyl-prolyl cis-trans isomerase [Catenuloplanes atrovinosus]|uniref:Peptidyl-prolyl cis-trans isomerase n=1 Tax=Catenuloplanes atrovinosus TaxID=137266 RepID=A0AAE3YT85_9ACTN|nr:FKBP-type peptidyl-prolyl cis-trans isomerase [Catenuloplanes atrovinosus]MDR7278215.1 peptidylprolyl isomerase [Catenuloplanes atrovinosus]